jgi:hypothetical protein
MANPSNHEAAPAALPQRPGRVGERVAELRTRAVADAVGAREEAWTWIEQLGRDARARRAEAHEQLDELFRCGQPADDVRGAAEGVLLTWTLHPLADRVLQAITDVWMPWLGKSFDRDAHDGANTVRDSARWPAKIVWPLYSMQEADGARSAFGFRTYVEAGAVDPEVQVLVIDYEKVPSNPRLLIRRMRDELVRVVPGVNLGKTLVDVPGREGLFGALYFALRSDLGLRAA